MVSLREYIERGAEKRVAQKMKKMSEDEKKARMAQRDAAICAYYKEGHKLAECSSRFRLGKQRILQILQAAGVWKPYEKTKRTKFLGVNVTEETKEALKREADKKGVSVSKLASDKLDATVA